jgi:hypothetical protein
MRAASLGMQVAFPRPDLLAPLSAGWWSRSAITPR